MSWRKEPFFNAVVCRENEELNVQGTNNNAISEINKKELHYHEDNLMAQMPYLKKRQAL